MFNLPAGFQPTDEWAHTNTGMSLAQYYKANPGAQSAYNESQNTPANLIKTATDAYNAQLEKYNKTYSDYTKANPFNLDDVLAKETANAKQELDPYYNQTLSDFLTGINTQRTQGEQDRATLLSNLAEDTNTYQGQQKQALQDTLDKTRQGFAGNGLYNSGANLTAQGRDVADTNQNLATNLTSADRSANQINTAGTRANQALDLQTSQEKTTNTQNESYDVASRAQAAIPRDTAQYQFQLGQATGPPPGQDANGFQNSLYSLLQ